MRSPHAAGSECGKEGRAPRLLRDAPSISCRRLRILEVHGAHSEGGRRNESFEYGTWGGEFRAEFAPQPGEIVAQEHWCSSGFVNTDLDLQLKKHSIHQIIVIGLIADTCIEATVRYAAELGYDVTVVKDATADYSDEMMHAALDINMTNYASAIVTTDAIVNAISSLQPSGVGAQIVALSHS
jgi:ureidoacrylate peracid hydrolase